MKEGDIYMNGMYHNPNDNWLPQPNGPEDRDAMIKAGCLSGIIFIVVMFIVFSIMALLSGCSPNNLLFIR